MQFLKSRFRLGIVSNVDDDLFAETARRLEVEFDWVDRRTGKDGFGATPEGRAEAELEVPDLRSLVAAIDPTATV